MNRNRLLALLSITLLMMPFAMAQNVAPVQSTGAVAIDLPDSSAQSVSLDIVKGRFSDYSVGRITLTGNGIDFRNGTLQGLKADVLDGDFDNVPVSKLSLSTPPFAFNTMELLNNKTFVLNQPVSARVSLQLTEQDLNGFIGNRKTLEKIEKAIAKKTGGISLITFNNPHLDLQSGNKIKLTVNGVIAQGMVVPLEMSGNLALKAGKLRLSGLSLVSNGSEVPLPVNVASVFEDKINEMIDFQRLGKNSMVIHADSMKLTGKTLIIEGNATLTRLKFSA